MDRHVYADFDLTIARHPSETDERLMLRVACFALHAHERLEFGKGISTEDEPDLWLRTLSNEIDLWIDLGTPHERRVHKACGRSTAVVLYCYGGRGVSIWWDKHAAQLQRFNNLKVYDIDPNTSRALATLAATNMSLQCTVQDGEVTLSTAQGDQVSIVPARLN